MGGAVWLFSASALATRLVSGEPEHNAEPTLVPPQPEADDNATSGENDGLLTPRKMKLCADLWYDDQANRARWVNVSNGHALSHFWCSLRRSRSGHSGIPNFGPIHRRSFCAQPAGR